MTVSNVSPSETDTELEDDPFEETGSLDDLIRRVVGESPDSEHAYLRESWLASVMGLLHRVRIAAGLSQEEVAQRLGTRQPSIARLERSDSTTLRRFWEFLHACGVVPADIATVPTAEMTRYVRAQPSAARSVESVRQWLADDNAATRQDLLEQYLAAVEDILQRTRIGQEIAPFPPGQSQEVRPLGPYMYQMTPKERVTVFVTAPQAVSFNVHAVHLTGAAQFPNVSVRQRTYAGLGSTMMHEEFVSQQPRTVA